MDAIKDRFVAQNMANVWPARRLQQYFPRAAMHRGISEEAALDMEALLTTSRRVSGQWSEFSSERSVVDKAVSSSAPFQVLKGVSSYSGQLQCVRSAQAKGQHRLAIRLTSRALRRQRKLPRPVRKALLPHILELLNLRSLSLIAVGECGEAWRCISLMSKLWQR